MSTLGIERLTRLSADSRLREAYILATRNGASGSCTQDLATAIIAKARSSTRPLVDLIEQHEPGHFTGMNKVREMDQLQSEAETRAKMLGIPRRILPVARVVFGVHDIGRHVEGALKLNTTRVGARHGVLTMLFLHEYGILKDLNPREQYMVYFATYYHAENTVPKPRFWDPGFLKDAYNICYGLRDLDKLNLFFDPKFLDSRGIIDQIKAHFLKGESGASIQTRIIEILAGPVDIEIMRSIRKGEPADMRLLTKSYSSYMAIRLAMLFDVRSRGALQEVKRNPDAFLTPTLDFISGRDEASARDIEKAVTDLFRLRGI